MNAGGTSQYSRRSSALLPMAARGGTAAVALGMVNFSGSWTMRAKQSTRCGKLRRNHAKRQSGVGDHIRTAPTRKNERTRCVSETVRWPPDVHGGARLQMVWGSSQPWPRSDGLEVLGAFTSSARR